MADDSFDDYVFLGLIGGVLSVVFVLALPILLPLYAIGRWVIAPLVDRFIPEAK